MHQLVAEAKLGRPLRDDEEVDHEDGDTFNNAWENLIVREIGEHAKLTRKRSAEKRAEKARRRAAKLAAEDEVPF